MKKLLFFIAFALLLSPNISFGAPTSDPTASFTNILPPQTTPFNGSGPLAPAGNTTAQSPSGQAASPTTAPSTIPDDALGLVCGLDTLTKCFALLPYWLFYTPATWFLAFGGMVFDAFTAYSLSSNVINASFVSSGWSTVRDISNAVFIFLLLYLGIKTILGLGDWKKPVGMIVIVALLMNFSLFFTKVMIDVSNLVAYQFYNAIGGSNTEVRTNPATPLGFEAHSISKKLVSAVGPQNIVSTDTFAKWKSGGESIGEAVIIFIAAGIIALALAWVLFWAAFLMLGRLLMFWMLMIFSPLAFIGLILPKAGELLGGNWWKMLTDQLLVAPVFLFFIYLTTFIMGSGIF